MKKQKFKNGDLLRDNVTGLEGVVMVIALYSTGCTHYGLQPKKVKEDGSLPDWSWLDQSRLALVKDENVKFDIDQFTEGGAMPCGPEM